MAPARRKILVAVDFGTTFSALAWAQTSMPSIQTVIQEWPGVDGAMTRTSDEKVPTESNYQDFICKWGFQIPIQEARHVWFKLGLDEDDKDNSYLAAHYQASKELPPSYDKKAADLATDYLSCLRNHLMTILESKLGKAVVTSTPIQYTITVPAIWSDKAQKLTSRCAKKAGMGDDIRVVSEPEAAAIHSLDVMDTNDYHAGDKFVVCDAGGGTVDLISLQIEKMGKPVEIMDCVPGDGHKCGASYLNRRFRKKLLDDYSMLQGWNDDVLEEAEIYFEDYIKKYFSGVESYRVPIFPLKDNPEKKIKRGRLHLSAADVEAIFSPTVASAIALLMAQVKKTPKLKSVFLVGGFSSSPFLRSAIKKVLPAGVELIIPAYARTAVVRGALIKALSEEVPAMAKFNITGRTARKHYGFSVSAIYDPVEHRAVKSTKYWDAYSGDWRVHVMAWEVKKGDMVYESQPIKITYNGTRKVSEGRWLDRSDDIYCWEATATTPGARGASGNIAPKYPKDATELAELTADLSSVPMHGIPRRTGVDGKEYYFLEFEIQIKFMSAYTEYSLWYNGVRYGTVEAEYC